MRFPFKKYRASNPLSSINLSPELMVELSNLKFPNKGVKAEALLDSGADFCLVNSRYSEILLVEDYKTGIQTKTRGVEGTSEGIDVYFHDVNFEIPNLPNSKFTIPFGFINSRSVNILLGRYILFDNFKITFEQKNNFFDIEVMT
jgi:hypothetical protein